MGLWWRTWEQRMRTATLLQGLDTSAVCRCFLKDVSAVLCVPPQGHSTTGFFNVSPTHGWNRTLTYSERAPGFRPPGEQRAEDWLLQKQTTFQMRLSGRMSVWVYRNSPFPLLHTAQKIIHKNSKRSRACSRASPYKNSKRGRARQIKCLTFRDKRDQKQHEIENTNFSYPSVRTVFSVHLVNNTTSKQSHHI